MAKFKPKGLYVVYGRSPNPIGEATTLAAAKNLAYDDSHARLSRKWTHQIAKFEDGIRETYWSDGDYRIEVIGATYDF